MSPQRKKKKKVAPVFEVIPYARPLLDIDDTRAVRMVLGSRWLTTGKEARLFEEELARYFNHHSALALSSCTAALHLALECLGVQGRPVVVPSLTFTATAAAVVMAGGIPVLADVDPDTLTLTGKTMLAAAGTHIAAVMPVHYGGNPSGFRSVLEEAAGHQIPVIDDAAHAFPALVDGVQVGDPALGAFGTCFSFYPTKPITTAEGGALLLQDAALLERARRLSLHGIDADAYQRSRAGLYHYQVVEHGWKYNLPDLLAALGRSQLRKVDSFWRRRTALAERYFRRFQSLAQQDRLRLPVVERGCASSWHLYVVRFPVERFATGWTRDRVAERLRELGVGTSMHYVPLHRQPYWQQRTQADPARFPHTEAAYQEILSLPIWPGMTEQHVDEVAERVTAVCREAQR
jgi:dTDP-4-amino-4,6-dideoxygalactose transaminase